MPISSRLAPVMLATAYGACVGSDAACQAKTTSTAYSGSTAINESRARASA